MIHVGHSDGRELRGVKESRRHRSLEDASGNPSSAPSSATAWDVRKKMKSMKSSKKNMLHRERWAQVGEDLVGDMNGSQFGWSIAMEDYRLAVGSLGNEVQVYTYEYDQWSPVGNVLYGEGEFGASLAIEGDMIAVASTFNFQGKVQVFTLSDERWNEEFELIGNHVGSLLGSCLSLSGNVLAVGAAGEGRVYLYERIGGMTPPWSLVETLEGTLTNWFGQSCAMHNNRLVVGAPFHDSPSGGRNSGLVRVFRRIRRQEWIQMGDDWTGIGEGDTLGSAVSIHGARVAAGALNALQRSGIVLVRQWNGLAFVPVGQMLSGNAPHQFFGQSVSVYEDLVAVGSYADTENGSRTGEVTIYRREVGEWVLVGHTIPGQLPLDAAGVSVALSSYQRVAIGAINHGGTGQARVFEQDYI